jgi:hypothetical protein
LKEWHLGTDFLAMLSLILLLSVPFILSFRTCSLQRRSRNGHGNGLLWLSSWHGVARVEF